MTTSLLISKEQRLCKILRGLKEKALDSNGLFKNNNNGILLNYDAENKCLLVDYDNIFQIFELEYHMDEKMILDFVNKYVVNILKIDVEFTFIGFE